jgi:hypothetical protein
MLRAIGSFIRRRVQIDVGPADIVLDVDSGDKPHWRADVQSNSLLRCRKCSSEEFASTDVDYACRSWCELVTVLR